MSENRELRLKAVQHLQRKIKNVEVKGLLEVELAELQQWRQGPHRYDDPFFEHGWKVKVESILRHRFGPDSAQLRGFQDVTSWTVGIVYTVGRPERQNLQAAFNRMLPNVEAFLKAIIFELDEVEPLQSMIDRLSTPNDTVERANFLFDKLQFHPKVAEASKSLFETRHYTQAIFEAFKAVNNFVKQKSGLPLDGKDLMAQTFREEDPVIRLNEGRTQSDKNEREGFRFLFMGAMVGIRNPKAHDDVVQTDPYRTLEYLSFASLLMKRAEEGKLRRRRKEKVSKVSKVLVIGSGAIIIGPATGFGHSLGLMNK